MLADERVRVSVIQITNLAIFYIKSTLTMKVITQAFSLVLALAQTGHAAFGPAFSTGPVGSGSWIREATSTLIVPNAPNPIVGNSVLWTGMGTDRGDLIQAINNNYPPDSL